LSKKVQRSSNLTIEKQRLDEELLIIIIRIYSVIGPFNEPAIHRARLPACLLAG